MIDIMHPKVMPEPNSGCWLWIGTIDWKDGYGRIIQMRSGKIWDRRTHRVSWEQHRGPIPDGMGVLHKCDNRLCVNPDHLYLGTPADNMRDRDQRGRVSKGDKHWARKHRGERHRLAKLSDADVAAIRADTRPIKVIAQDYPVGWRWIEKLRTRNGPRR